MTPQTPSLPAPARPGVSAWWRAATYALLVVLAILWASGASLMAQFTAQVQHLQNQVAQTAHIRYLSVLLDEKAQPALLVTLDPQDASLQLQRLNTVQEGREDTMQLWALRPGVAAPVSLGVLPSKVVTLRLALAANALDEVSGLAISVEDKGGVDNSKGPRLPYLFQGALVQKAL
jgi:anti-sigma-K factor RskA